MSSEARDRAIEAVTLNLASTVNLYDLPPEAIATFAVDELLLDEDLLNDLSWDAGFAADARAAGS